METKQAEGRQVEPQKQWREEGVENTQAEHRPCSERRGVQRDKRSEGQAEESCRGGREKGRKDICARKGRRGRRRNKLSCMKTRNALSYHLIVIPK